MDDLVLLGRWAETPLIAWPGYCDEAQNVFKVETGFCPEPFTLLREGLHEQYYFHATVESLKQWFISMDAAAQRSFSDDLYRRYYNDASTLELFTSHIAALNTVKASDASLIELINEWMRLPARLAPPIFFSVLLDIWYRDREAEIADIITTAAGARDHCANVYDIQAKREAERIFSEVAVRLSTSWENLQMLFPEEILAWMAGDVTRSDHIQPRREFFVTENKKGHYTILDGEEAGARISQVALAVLGEPQTHLEGLPAYAGLVFGRAKKILSTEDARSFEEGDILVAYQTSVWYEPLFSKARAVLTELGGATSHAAVICAERRIPCIVGIPNLVRSVTNGDQLAVDAARGLVDIT
jgi:phosphohistidine swiveling domain-containing protein